MNNKKRNIIISISALIVSALVICSVFLGDKLGIGISNANSSNTITKSDANVKYTLSLQSSWNEGSKYGYVYELSIENISSSTQKNWNCDINLGSGAEFIQGWCGEYESSGDKLSIKSVDYNSSLGKGGKVTCGFIVKYSAKHSTDDMSIIICGESTDQDTSNNETTKVPENNDTQNNEATKVPENNDATKAPVIPETTVSPDNSSNDSSSDNDQNVSGGFKVSGTKLLDANGNEFIMRGINHAHAWYREYLNTAIPAIAKTGANTVRVVLGDGQQWTKDDASSVKEIINLCKKNNLVAIVEVHDVTGSNDAGALDKTADYWIEIKDALIGNESYVILNIANEWYGDWNGEAWANGYKSVIPKLRKAGIKNTIMVDSAGWGQYPESIKSYGKSVFESDSLANTMFSIHMYEYAGSDASTIKNNIDGVLGQGLCVCIGEFGYKHTNGDVDEEYIMQYCSQKNVGYIGWSWKGNGSGVEYLDIANSWDGSSLSSDWGEKLINGTYGIKNTSKKCSVY